MKNENTLVYSTEVASYFIWEYTQHSNAIDLWYCTEDIGFFLERNDILSIESFERLSKSPRFEITYIVFLRQIAFKIYIHTRNEDHLFNWYVSERLISNLKWCNSIIAVAAIYRKIREEKKLPLDLIRTNWIKNKLSI